MGPLTRPTFNPRPSTCLLLLAFAGSGVQALSRTVGSPSDELVQSVAVKCGANNATNFEFGNCPNLMGCVLDNLPSPTTQGFSSGTAIASLLPTIIALLGYSPMDLIQFAFFSPIRALATAFFGLGIPGSLFAQLVPVAQQPRPGQKPKTEELMREWSRSASVIVPVDRPWENLIFQVALDLVAMALAAVMPWRNATTCLTTMVTWRCDYTYLLIAWPVACVSWLIISIGLLYLISEKIEILVLATDGSSTTSSIWNIFSIPYQAKRQISKTNQDANRTGRGSYTEMTDYNPAETATVAPSLRDDPKAYSKSVIRVTMPTANGIRSWRVFETIVETLSVGIYLYATFVLTSTVFLSGENAIVYASVMTLSLSALKVVGKLF